MPISKPGPKRYTRDTRLPDLYFVENVLPPKRKRAQPSRGFYMARIYNRYKNVRRNFPVSIYGSKEDAFNAAVQWHQEQIKELSKLPLWMRKNCHLQARRKIAFNHSTGYIGVSFHRCAGRKGPGLLLATWTDDGKQKSNCFSIAQYGYETALQHAIARRQKALEDLFGYTGPVVVNGPSEREIIQRVQTIVPTHLPLYIIEEVQQEIMLAIFERSISLSALDTHTARTFLQKVSRSYSNPYSHVSLDHLLADGRRLEDVIEG
jgi:hypothetical protein